MSSLSLRLPSLLEAARRNPALGYNKWGKVDSGRFITESLYYALSDTTNAIEVGSPDYQNGLVGDGGSGIRFDLTATGLNKATALASGGQLAFEISPEALDYWDIDDHDFGFGARTAFEYFFTFSDTNTTGGNRSIIGASPTSNLFRVAPFGATQVNNRLTRESFRLDDNEWARVNIWWDATNYWVAVNGLLLIDGIAHGFGVTSWNYLWIGMDRGNTSAALGSQAETLPHRIRHVQMSTTVPTFATLPTGYLYFWGDSYMNGAIYDYASGVWNGFAPTYTARVSIRMSAYLMDVYNIKHTCGINGEGGHYVSNSVAADVRLLDDIATPLAANPYHYVLQCSTNDANLETPVPDDFEASAKMLTETLMGGTNARTLTWSNACSLRGRDDNLNARAAENTQTVRRILRGIPAWWDKKYPHRRGRVATCDIYAALGGDLNARPPGGRAAALFEGQMHNPGGSGSSKVNADLHPSGVGYRKFLDEAYIPRLVERFARFG